MEGIDHRTVAVNGINMHIAEKGSGPLVLMLHGFPELWYSWRHQILGLADHGYHAVAPDMRGYGDTDVPLSHQSYTSFHIVGDLIALLDVLGENQVFVVGHDWGAIIAWHLCLLRPDRVKALVNLSVAFLPRNPLKKPVEGFRESMGDDFYICKFQKPGQAEAEYAYLGTTTILKMIFLHRGPLSKVNEGGNVDLPNNQTASQSMHDWLTDEDLNYFSEKFNKTGFTGGFNYYRALDLTWELMAPWTGVKVEVPVKFILGDQDLTYHFAGMKDYIHKGGFKADVPFLQELVLMEGVGHFIMQEKPHEITSHILDFIRKF